MAKHNGDYHVLALRSSLSGITLEKVSANHNSWASMAPGHRRRFAVALGCLLLL